MLQSSPALLPVFGESSGSAE